MKKSFRVIVALSVVAGFVAISGQAFAEGEDTDAYAGVKMCIMCHKKDAEGKLVQIWQDGPHAKAVETLGTPEAKAMGAKVGVADPQKSEKCLICHTTAYDGKNTVQTQKNPVESGVTCESCHGAGKNYKTKTIMSDRKQSEAAGMIYPATKSCVKCHNEKSPAWNPERYTTKDGKKTGFDPDQAYEKIKHKK